MCCQAAPVSDQFSSSSAVHRADYSILHFQCVVQLTFLHQCTTSPGGSAVALSSSNSMCVNLPFRPLGISPASRTGSHRDWVHWFNRFFPMYYFICVRLYCVFCSDYLFFSYTLSNLSSIFFSRNKHRKLLLTSSFNFLGTFITS